jgi:hypothetical protein
MENNDIIKQRQDRFKHLGIPVPIEKPAFDQAVVNVKDPKMLQRINEIKNGAKKGEFNEMLHVGDKKGFQPLPEPKKNTNNRQSNSETKAPALESFAPIKSSGGDLDMFDKLFSAETPSIPTSKVNRNQIIQEDINTDTTGSDFLNNFRQKLQAKAMSGGANIPAVNNSGFGFKTQNENVGANIQEIEQKIYEISSTVSKKIAQETIEKVLNEYLSKKTNSNENTFQRINENVIKIGEKYYKLTPVTVKQKSK